MTENTTTDKRYEQENEPSEKSSLPGIPNISPSRYCCPTHGLVLAPEVEWDRDDNPLCPHCKKRLTPK